MTTVYVLLAECLTSGGVTADAYPTIRAASVAAQKLTHSGYPCTTRIVRVMPGGECKVISHENTAATERD